MNLTSTKILVSILFGILRFIFGVLPIKLYKFLLRWEEEDDSQHFINKKRHDQVNCALALCQSFGGGVLFATCFIHMMPEVYKSIEELKKFGGLNTNYPLSQLIVSCGFFLIYFVEETSHWLVTKISDKPCVTPPKINKISPTPSAEKKIIKEYFEEESKNENCENVENEEKIIIDDNISYNEEVLKENERNVELNNEMEKAVEIEKVLENEAKTKQQLVRGVLIVLALSFHAIFEGLAIGLQSSVANIWYLFTAVSIHSATILFCVGLEMLLVKTKIRIIVYHVLILSVTSPFGVLLGLLITIKANMNTKAKSTAVVLLEGLSAGTILYITFFEVLNREKERRIYRFRRAICILGGFALMAFLQCMEVYD